MRAKWENRQSPSLFVVCPSGRYYRMTLVALVLSCFFPVALKFRYVALVLDKCGTSSSFSYSEAGTNPPFWVTRAPADRINYEFAPTADDVPATRIVQVSLLCFSSAHSGLPFLRPLLRFKQKRRNQPWPVWRRTKPRPALFCLLQDDFATPGISPRTPSPTEKQHRRP